MVTPLSYSDTLSLKMGTAASLFHSRLATLGDADVLPQGDAEAAAEACPGPRGQVAEKEEELVQETQDCALMAAGKENKNSNSGGTGVAQASWAKEAGFLS